MENLDLPFLPSSVIEQWLLAGDAEETCLVLGEIIDLYLAVEKSERKDLAPSEMTTLIEQVALKLKIHDNTLCLNCLRLLKLIAEDNAMLYVDLAVPIYSHIQTLLGDSSRIVRKAALSFAATLSAEIPMHFIAEHVLKLIESNTPQYHEYRVQVACISLLNLALYCFHSSINGGDTSNNGLLRPYVVRMANCAMVHLLSSGSSNEEEEENKSRQEATSSTQNATSSNAGAIAAAAATETAGGGYSSECSSDSLEGDGVGSGGGGGGSSSGGGGGGVGSSSSSRHKSSVSLANRARTQSRNTSIDLLATAVLAADGLSAMSKLRQAAVSTASTPSRRGSGTSTTGSSSSKKGKNSSKSSLIIPAAKVLNDVLRDVSALHGIQLQLDENVKSETIKRVSMIDFPSILLQDPLVSNTVQPLVEVVRLLLLDDITANSNIAAHHATTTTTTTTTTTSNTGVGSRAGSDTSSGNNAGGSNSSGSGNSSGRSKPTVQETSPSEDKSSSSNSTRQHRRNEALDSIFNGKEDDHNLPTNQSSDISSRFVGSTRKSWSNSGDEQNKQAQTQLQQQQRQQEQANLWSISADSAESGASGGGGGGRVSGHGRGGEGKESGDVVSSTAYLPTWSASSEDSGEIGTGGNTSNTRQTTRNPAPTTSIGGGGALLSRGPSASRLLQRARIDEHTSGEEQEVEDTRASVSASKDSILGRRGGGGSRAVLGIATGDETATAIDDDSRGGGEVGKHSVPSSAAASASTPTQLESPMQRSLQLIKKPIMRSRQGPRDRGDSLEDESSSATATAGIGASNPSASSPNIRASSRRKMLRTREGEVIRSESPAGSIGGGGGMTSGSRVFFNEHDVESHSLLAQSESAAQLSPAAGRNRAQGVGFDFAGVAVEEERLTVSTPNAAATVMATGGDSSSSSLLGCASTNARLKRSRLKSANAAQQQQRQQQQQVDVSQSLDTGTGSHSSSSSHSHQDYSPTKAPVFRAKGHNNLGHHNDLLISDSAHSPPHEKRSSTGTSSSANANASPVRHGGEGRGGGGGPAGGGGEVESLIMQPDSTYDYIASDDIVPISAPVQAMNKAVKALEVQDWPEIFHTLNTIRQLALHHQAVILNSGHLHNIIRVIMKNVDNLRSSLAKNAMITIGDLLRGLGRNMDTEVATIVPGLLKRSSDSSIFLVESADCVLSAMLENVSYARSLTSLLANASHRSPGLRGKVAMCFHTLIIYKGEELPASKDFEAFKAALAKLAQDSTPEARTYGRECVRLLAVRGIVSRIEWEQCISVDLLERILRRPSGGGGDNSSMVTSSVLPVLGSPEGSLRTATGEGAGGGGGGYGSGGGTPSRVSNLQKSPVRSKSSGGYLKRTLVGQGGGGGRYSTPERQGRGQHPYSADARTRHPTTAAAAFHVDSSGGEEEDHSFVQEEEETAAAAAVTGGGRTRSQPPQRRRSQQGGGGEGVGAVRRGSKHRSDDDDDDIDNDDAHAEEEHNLSHLMVSAEHLSSQIDAQLMSPLRQGGGRGRGVVGGNAASFSPHSSSGTKGGGGVGHDSSSHSSSMGSHSSGGAGGGGGGSSAAAMSAAAKRRMESDPELGQLQSILLSTTVKSWTDRKTALDRVIDLLVRNYDTLRDAGKLSACVDCLLERLSDGSAKVHMHTINCLEKLNEEEPLILQHNLVQIVVPAVMNSASTNNKPIAAKSLQLIRHLFDTLPPAQVAQYLCHAALHETEKLRLTCLKFLADVTPVFCADQDTIVGVVKKTIFPSLCKILFAASTKGDVRVCASDGLRSLQACLPADKLWLWSDDPHQQEELKRITANV